MDGFSNAKADNLRIEPSPNQAAFGEDGFVPLLGRRMFHGFDDSGRHVSDERHCVPDDPTPLGFLPDIRSRLLPLLEVVVAPNVLHVIQLANLTEKTHESLCLLMVSHSGEKKRRCRSQC